VWASSLFSSTSVVVGPEILNSVFLDETWPKTKVHGNRAHESTESTESDRIGSDRIQSNPVQSVMNSQFEKMCPDSKRCQKPTYKYYIFVLGVNSGKGVVIYD